jgi:serine/threonine protein kinase
MRGKWQGSWKMSKDAEKILYRMIQPNADQRCTAPEALQDPYWDLPSPTSAHKPGGIPCRSRSRDAISPSSSRRVFKTRQSGRKHAEVNQIDKENVPITAPNMKKGPGRQRVLSGTDGEYLFPFWEG